MKFASVHRGKRAERAVEMLLEDGATFKTLVRPLDGNEESLVLERAYAYAKKKGIDSPKEGDPVYDLGFMAEAVAVGCVDPDSPENARAPSFEGGVAEVHSLSREQIAFLYEHLELWQDECSPQRKKLSQHELFEALTRCAEAEDDLPLLQWGPALRMNLLRISARLSLNSLAAKLSSGTSYESNGIASKSEPAKKKNAAAPR